MRRPSAVRPEELLTDVLEDITNLPLSGKIVRTVLPPLQNSADAQGITPQAPLLDNFGKKTPPAPEPGPEALSALHSDLLQKGLFDALPPIPRGPSAPSRQSMRISQLGIPFFLGILLADGFLVLLKNHWSNFLVMNQPYPTQLRMNILVAAFIGILVWLLLITTMATLRTMKTFKMQLAVLSSLKTLWSTQGTMQGSVDSLKSSKPTSSIESSPSPVTPIEGPVVLHQTVGRVSLAAKLSAVQWRITPLQFRFLQAMLSLSFFILAWFTLSFSGQIGALLMPPIVLSEFLNWKYSQCLRKFEPDFFAFLLSFSQLLRVGMDPMTALAAAGKSLPTMSDVKRETTKVLDALRSGLPQECALALFGEHLPQPQVVSFRKAVFLSHRSGGPLAEMLGQLSHQVKVKRSLHAKAVSVVQEERMSMIVISLMMSGVFIITLYGFPEIVLISLSSTIGRNIFEGGLVLLFLSVLWALRLTDVRC